jgi:hypothetical protein
MRRSGSRADPGQSLNRDFIPAHAQLEMIRAPRPGSRPQASLEIGRLLYWLHIPARQLEPIVSIGRLEIVGS